MGKEGHVYIETLMKAQLLLLSLSPSQQCLRQQQQGQLHMHSLACKEIYHLQLPKNGEVQQ